MPNNQRSEPAPIRTLLADDYEQWRGKTREILQFSGLQIIGEVSDGLEVVYEALQQKPDLILLDIGLPSLNGIEAAKRIHSALPDTKIFFVSMHQNLDVVRAALSNEASGFVLKLDARRELWPSIQAVLRGEQFVSSSVRVD